jgi:hypothetical protein
MLGVRNYTKEYIDGCRSRVDADLSTYKKLAAAARNQPAGVKALEAFEITFFNNMVLVLDHLFVHRLRTIEGKDGNPLNEVRLLCDAILNNNNIMGTDKTIKFDPARSVLKYKVGDEIKLNEAHFALLSKAFFAEIERKFL